MDPSTDSDRYVIEQVNPLLEPGERVAVCAYLVPPIEGGKIGVFIDAATKMAALAAVTDRRLILVETRIGAFGPLQENHGVRSIPRERIKGSVRRQGEEALHRIVGRRDARVSEQPFGETRVDAAGVLRAAGDDPGRIQGVGRGTS